jgi:hypothetical protein
MKQITFFFLILISILILMPGCKPKEQVAAIKGRPVLANAPVIVYKTKLDYSMQVPVTLSADKSALVSFPAPSDVYYGGDLAYPVALVNGYFLDRRGIDVNSAFTKWTYYEYSRLSGTPSVKDIFNMMLDTDPFLEIYHCGDRTKFDDIETELNSAIKKGKLDQYKRLK